MNHFFTTVKNMRSNTSNTGHSKSHELESWQRHSGRSAVQRTPENFFLPSQNDQAHLISTAAGPEQRQNSISSVRSEPHSTKLEGISRNVIVSQVFEIVR
jgi:hypothetical protein